MPSVNRIRAHVSPCGAHKMEGETGKGGGGMERFSLDGGRGWLTVREENGRVRMEGQLPDDRRGLYKGWLLGSRGRALAGTFVPEGGVLKLRRTLSLDELRRQGAWPPTGGLAELAFAAGAPPRGNPAPPAGWRWEPHPAGRMGEPLLARAVGERRVLYRPEDGGFSLACPFDPAKPFPLTPLFCFASVRRLGDRWYAVFPFRPGGCPRPPDPAEGGDLS